MNDDGDDDVDDFLPAFNSCPGRTTAPASAGSPGSAASPGPPARTTATPASPSPSGLLLRASHVEAAGAVNKSLCDPTRQSQRLVGHVF